MTLVERDGRWYSQYGPDELGAPLGAPTNHSKATLLRMAIQLLGGGGRNGPLMDACTRQAEHRHYGGHRHK